MKSTIEHKYYSENFQPQKHPRPRNGWTATRPISKVIVFGSTRLGWDWEWTCDHCGEKKVANTRAVARLGKCQCRKERKVRRTSEDPTMMVGPPLIMKENGKRVILYQCDTGLCDPSQVASVIGIKRSSLIQRVNRDGWDSEHIFSPKCKKGKRLGDESANSDNGNEEWKELSRRSRKTAEARKESVAFLTKPTAYDFMYAKPINCDNAMGV